MGRKVQRKGRTLALTINELLESPRFQIAVRNYKDDPMFMRAILTELGMEAEKVAKSTIIKHYNMHSDLDQYEMLGLLRSVTDFTMYSIYWSLNETEQQLYMADPKGQLTSEKRVELLERLTKQFMGS
jgi:hypothetical protein